ncbi:MAG: hypothetical protein ACI4MF_09610 [Candidatus Faecivicinus sp.]
MKWLAGKKRGSGAEPPVLCLYGEDGAELYHGRIDAYPFPEEAILEGSVEFFNDPCPCEIHRRAVQLRFCEELTGAVGLNRTLALDMLPDFVRRRCGGVPAVQIRIEAAER